MAIADRRRGDPSTSCPSLSATLTTQIQIQIQIRIQIQIQTTGKRYLTVAQVICRLYCLPRSSTNHFFALVMRISKPRCLFQPKLETVCSQQQARQLPSRRDRRKCQKRFERALCPKPAACCLYWARPSQSPAGNPECVPLQIRFYKYTNTKTQTKVQTQIQKYKQRYKHNYKLKCKYNCYFHPQAPSLCHIHICAVQCVFVAFGPVGLFCVFAVAHCMCIVVSELLMKCCMECALKCRSAV